MQLISPPDSHYLRSAIGWLELGNTKEARAELMSVAPMYEMHPGTLEVWWLILSKEENWAEALRVANKLVELTPDDPAAILHKAYAARRAPDGGVQAAWDTLRPALDQFPTETTISFNLACYACLLGKPSQAIKFLRLAYKSGGPRAIKAMALRDPDLQTIWEVIRRDEI